MIRLSNCRPGSVARSRLLRVPTPSIRSSLVGQSRAGIIAALIGLCEAPVDAWGADCLGAAGPALDLQAERPRRRRHAARRALCIQSS